AQPPRAFRAELKASIAQRRQNRNPRLCPSRPVEPINDEPAHALSREAPHVGLQPDAVLNRQGLPSRAKHVLNPASAVPRVGFGDEPLPTGDRVVSDYYEPAGRVEGLRHLLQRDEAGPLVTRLPTPPGQAPAAPPAYRDEGGEAVPDVAVDVGVGDSHRGRGHH